MASTKQISPVGATSFSRDNNYMSLLAELRGFSSLWSTNMPRLWRCLRNADRNLRQQIVSTAAGDFSPNEFAHRGRLRKNDPRIDIGRVGFTARDMRLIDKQF